MDLLYGDRIAFKPNGEPMVTLGIATGRERVVLRADVAMVLDFYEAGVLKHTTVRADDSVEVTLIRAQPAKRRVYVDLEGVPFGATDKLDWALAGWRARGYAQVEALEEGTVIGMGGKVIDNREIRVVLPVQDRREANDILDEIYRRFGLRPTLNARLLERPWGELLVKAGGAPMGRATSFVRLLAPDNSIGIDSVEFGKGYSWHGSETRSYRGEIYVVVDPDGRLSVVNVLGAETILRGVVPAEIFASAPLEALKAQAVAARNQLFAKLGKRHHDDPFHLCSEQHCQVYAGTSKEDPRTNEAIRATTGELAFRDGKLVDTVYSSSCGGHTEDNDAVWGNRPDPALRAQPDFEPVGEPTLAAFAQGINETNVHTWVTTKPPSYCSRATKANPEKYRWRRSFTREELTAILNASYPQLGPVKNLTVHERGRGGRVMGLLIDGERASVTVHWELNIRRLFSNLNSGTFEVDVERDGDGRLAAVTFVGGGWGHGVGLCQVGAVGRAEAGHTYRQILSHYYNGATAVPVYETP